MQNLPGNAMQGMCFLGALHHAETKSAFCRNEIRISFRQYSMLFFQYTMSALPRSGGQFWCNAVIRIGLNEVWKLWVPYHVFIIDNDISSFLVEVARNPCMSFHAFP